MVSWARKLFWTKRGSIASSVIGFSTIFHLRRAQQQPRFTTCLDFHKHENPHVYFSPQGNRRSHNSRRGLSVGRWIVFFLVKFLGHVRHVNPKRGDEHVEPEEHKEAKINVPGTLTNPACRYLTGCPLSTKPIKPAALPPPPLTWLPSLPQILATAHTPDTSEKINQVRRTARGPWFVCRAVSG